MVTLLASLLLAILALGWIRKIPYLIVFKGELQGEFLSGFHCENKSAYCSQPEQYNILRLKELKSSIIFLNFFLSQVFLKIQGPYEKSTNSPCNKVENISVFRKKRKSHSSKGICSRQLNKRQ